MSAILQRLGLVTLARSAGLAGLLFLASSLLVFAFESRGGAALARYKSKSFVNDVVYSAFYRGGFYAVFVWALVVNLLGNKLAFLQLHVLDSLPLYAAVPIYWIVGDLLLYWLHRAQHHFPWLWAFHSVHHAEQQLSTLSQSRRHPAEQVLNGLAVHLPLVFVLGLPTRAWLPWYALAQMLQSAQHAELDWRFGPLYRVVVSPVFHSIHHGTHERFFNRNFGQMFSCWDYLFGTASSATTRPAEYGVRGLVMRESLVAQLVAPFRMFRRAAPAPAALDTEPGDSQVGATSTTVSR